ncbi:NUDIX domain-containing protein [Citricoccus sp. GCM10030269]|uniref:NUDIX domain-containing protein n=1 Tax=Citricoccus sp. GCM10030269 TaxID=3273388 RepID=UPI00360C1960
MTPSPDVPPPYVHHDGGPLADVVAPRAVVETETAFSGAVWDVTRDAFRMSEAGGPDSETGDRSGDDTDLLVREYIQHPGAVAVVALDDEDRIRMIRQYRHPVRQELWEIPAGLLDVPGESSLAAAQRELAEEADLRAARWDVLAEFFTTPGSSSEAIRVYLARELTVVPENDRHERTGEEAGMPLASVPVAEAVDAVLTGRLHNPATVVGILALHAHRTSGYTRLRAADAP